MKIIHTSDWHLGQHFYRFDRNDEHSHFIAQLCSIVKELQPDALLISGDIFDNVAPAASVQKLFVDSILNLHETHPTMVLVLIAGNHDSGPRLEVSKRLWERFNVHVYGGCQRREDGTFDPAQYILHLPGKGIIVAAPYFHTSNYPPVHPGLERDERKGAFFQALLDEAAAQNTSRLPVVMMAHIAVEGCNLRGHEEGLIGDLEQELPETLGKGFDYLALGHIHKPQTLSGTTAPMRYCGSPLPLSFSEDYEHSVTCVEIAGHESRPLLRILPIRPLRGVKTLPEKGGDIEDALRALSGLEESDNSYIRLLVDREGILPADAEHRANALTRNKQCRFCEIRKTARAPHAQDADRFASLNIEELKTMPPMEIATRYYAHTQGHALDDELTRLMQQAIDATNEDNTQHP